MVISACGTDQTETSGVSAPSSAPTTTAATVSPTTSQASEATVDPKAVEDYLVALANLEGDLGDQLSENETICNESTQGVEEPTEEQVIENGRCHLSGLIEGIGEHATAVAAVTPPGGFEFAHTEYVDAIQARVDQMQADSVDLTSPDEIFDYLTMVFFGIELTPAMESLMLAQATSCRTLEQLGNDAGYSVELSCPQEPVEPVEPVEPLTVDVQVGGPWMADPNPLAATEGDVDMTLTNVGDEPIQPVVIVIFEGDPTNLLLVDGVVDLSLSGVTDPSSGFASFGVEYPDVFGEGDSKVGEVATLAPGETAEITMFGSDVFVVFDYQAGEFEAGSYVVIERDGT
jgi:hypothetical protein